MRQCSGSLSKIRSTICIPIKTDKYPRDKEYIYYARMLIEVPLEGPFPKIIEFINDYGLVVKQRVHFEWKPTKCNHCLRFGHEGKDFRKKQGAIKEWRVVYKPMTESSAEEAV